MTELQSALLLRRQLAGERAAGRRPGRAAIARAAARRLLPASPPPGPAAGRPKGSSGRRPGRVRACEGGEPEAPGRAGPSTSSPAFGGHWGRGRAPARTPGRAWRPGGRRGARPRPHCSVGRGGGGARVPSPATLLGGAGPASGAAEAAGPWGRGRSGPGPRRVPARVSELRAGGGGESGRRGWPLAGGARRAKLLPGQRRVRGVVGDNKSAGRRGLVALARGSEDLAGSGTAALLPPPGTGSGRAARLGEGGAGRGESRWLAGAGLCAPSSSGPCAGPRSPGAAARGLRLGAAAGAASPEVPASPLPHCPSLRPFAASRLTF